MLRSAALILSGNAVSALLTLARNLIVARLIPVPDYGVAATFAIVMSVIEMTTELGLQQQIVQARRGDDAYFQAALQGFQLLRGAFAGLVFLILAAPAARFMGAPEAAWAYQLLALMPLLRGLTHFDIWRLNRHMIFWPSVLTNAVPPLISLLLLWPLAKLFDDWRVMLWAIVAQMALMMLASHLVARRPYRLVLDREIMAKSLAFGWPLLINSILLFAVFNGDRVIVGRELGMAALGLFAMGYTLTLPPTLVLAKSAQSFFLPLLSRAEHQLADTPDEAAEPELRKRRDRLAAAILQVSLINGAAMIAGVMLIGIPLMSLVLGAKYAALLPLLPLFAAMHAMRAFKAAPAVIALARGNSGNAMIGNAPRIAALPISWLAVNGGAGVETVLWIGLASETLGWALAQLMLRRGGARLPLDRLRWPVILALAQVALALFGFGFAPELPDLVLPGARLVLLVALLVSARDLWHGILRRHSEPMPPHPPSGT